MASYTDILIKNTFLCKYSSYILLTFIKMILVKQVDNTKTTCFNECFRGNASTQLRRLYPVVKSTSFLSGVPFANASKLSPQILTIRSKVSTRWKPPEI